MNKIKSILPCLFVAVLAVLVAKPSAAQDLSNTTIRTTPLAPGVYMFDCVGDFGGGNVTASVGNDGILIADNMYVAMMPKLMAALKALSDKPIRFAVNSHFHMDHIAGNTELGSAATIIAHENGRKRLEQKTPAPSPALLPSFTFTDRAHLHFNGEDVRLIHLPNGHTDADVVIYFSQSKVVHMGDMFFFGMFPAVYTQGGGNIKQLIINLEKILLEVAPDSKVVPGHGELATIADLKSYVAMLKETTGIVEEAIRKGKSLDQMTREKSFSKYDNLGSGGAQTTDQYLSMVYKLLTEGK